MPSRPIVAFGNSITFGYTLPRHETWVHRLESRLRQARSDPSLRVINSGVNGNTSRQALERIQRDVLDHGPSLVLVEFGGNDATNEEAKHVPDAEFARNITSIREKVHAVGGRVLYVTFPPLIDEWHPRGELAVFKRYGGFDRRIDINRQATIREALNSGSGIFDLDIYLRTQARMFGWEPLVMRDGVHLTARANELVAEALTPLVNEMLPTSATTSLGPL